MKIVMFTLDDRVDRRILLQAESLRDSGYHVEIINPAALAEHPSTSVHSGSGAKLDGSSISAFLACIPILHIYRDANFRKILSFFGLNANTARSLFWRLQRRPDRFYRRMFAPAIASLQAQIYVAHDLPMLPVAAAAVASHNGKVVYDSHELFGEQDFSNYERRMWRRLEARYIKLADRVITINESIAGELAERYDIDRPAVIRNLDRCDPDFKPSKRRYFHGRFGLSPLARVVLFQGGLSPNRNLENLLLAMRYVAEELLCLVMLGDGPSRKSLQKLSENLSLQGRIFFHDPVPQKDLLGIAGSADAGIIPYAPTCLNNVYCTPNKLFEFIAARIPIIATDLPEVSKIVRGYDIGVVGDTSTPESLAHLLDSFFADQTDRARLARNLEIAARDLSWEQEEPNLVRIYRELAEIESKP